MKFASSDELCRHVYSINGDTVILSFSMGKDAIASYLQLKRYFKRIELFHLYVVPGLDFVERELARFEDALGQEIHRGPGTAFFRMLRNSVYQPPERLALLDDLAMPEPDLETIDDWMRLVSGNHWIATGVRQTDSLARRMTMAVHGPWKPKRRQFFPVYDWKIDRLVDEIERSGIKLPVDYEMFGRTFDGIDYHYLAPIKERFPEDYEKILYWFPLAELDEVRRGLR